MLVSLNDSERYLIELAIHLKQSIRKLSCRLNRHLRHELSADEKGYRDSSHWAKREGFQIPFGKQGDSIIYFILYADFGIRVANKDSEILKQGLI